MLRRVIGTAVRLPEVAAQAPAMAASLPGAVARTLATAVAERRVYRSPSGASHIPVLGAHEPGAEEFTRGLREALTALDGVRNVEVNTGAHGLAEEEAWHRHVRDVSGPEEPGLGRLTLDELDNPLTPVLATGAGISAVVGSVADAALIVGVLGVNALISGAQRMGEPSAWVEGAWVEWRPRRGGRGGWLRTGRRGRTGMAGGEPGGERGRRDRVHAAALTRDVTVRAGTTAAAAFAAWLLSRPTATPGQAATTGLVALVGSQLLQTMAAGGTDPLVLGSGVVSMGVLATIVQVPGLSHFFGCRPLLPHSWLIGLGSAGASTMLATILTRATVAAPVPER